MERRDLLSTACLSLVGLSGCAGALSDPNPDGFGPNEGTPASPTPLSDYSCPPHGPQSDPVVCSHTVDSDTANVYLLTETTTDSDTPRMTLYNESSTELVFNPYQWTIAERTDTGWEQIPKRVSASAKLALAPGDTHSWTFRDAVDAITYNVTLDPGTYTASISVPNLDSSDGIRCIALVRVDEFTIE